MMTDSAAFDALAPNYDERFSHRQPATWLRDAVHRRIGPFIGENAQVVELGCGSGEDTLRFASQSHRVWALDASGPMLDCCRGKVDAAGVGERVELRQRDLREWQHADLGVGQGADLVFSNFGVLNCIAGLCPVFATANRCLREGGHLAVVLMGPFCLTETVYFAATGQFRKAARRWRSPASFRVGDESYPVWYHSPRTVRRAALGFEHIASYGIGGLLPPSEGYGLCERWPRVFARLARWDYRLAGLLSRVSDHYLMILEKRGDGA